MTNFEQPSFLDMDNDSGYVLEKNEMLAKLA